MATQTMQAYGPAEDNMQPLVSLPSPTLTNPDMVLPNDARNFRVISSPPRPGRRDRPPSPSYLKEQTNESPHSRSTSGASAVVTPKREKLGLMSRKMMLLRSRTASNGLGVQQTNSPSDEPYASSPTIMHGNSLAPGPIDDKRASTSGSSTNSYDMSTLPQFLAKYETSTIGTDEDLDSSPAVGRYGPNSLSGSDAERRQKEQDEQHSAILSKRAEQILANAKKRLNLMEGNLRGARDLVAPLTAANLKRATSVGSAYVSPAVHFRSRQRYVQEGYSYEAAVHPPYRTLHTQASSPTMGKDFQGHWRGFSETEIADRPFTALERTASPIVAQGYIPTKAYDPSWTKTLKGSRSHDSLSGSLRGIGMRDMVYRGSPDPNLEPLVEDEGQTYPTPPRSASSRAESREDYRATSTPEDLHEQMSSLKGRISALRERAREDSLRRQSLHNLREPSPLNNASAAAPEFFYGASSGYESPVQNTKTGAGYAPYPDSPEKPQSPQQSWERDELPTSSRNAFAEQAQRQLQVQHSSSSSSDSITHKNGPQQAPRQRPFTHTRTPSGTAIIQSSKHRYSHRHYYHVPDTPSPSTAEFDEISIGNDGSSRYGDDEDSEAGRSVYEEALSEPEPTVVAHEDRADAFDYENFFLHSAMAIYGNGERRGSTTSSEESVDSVETARGPTVPADNFGFDNEFDAEPDDYPPESPQTPEKLRQIERNLHQRTFSNDSVSTMATFATATEGRDTPDLLGSKPPSALGRPISPPSNLNARPNTAIPIKQRPTLHSDSSSERADSGVSLNGGNEAPKRPNTSSPIHKSSLSANATTMFNAISPPMSPQAFQDPATVAVNALLAPGGRKLGLRDKALLFGLVESLKTVCHELQAGEETSYDNRMLRRRLDDARRVLSGSGEVRPGTS